MPDSVSPEDIGAILQRIHALTDVGGAAAVEQGARRPELDLLLTTRERQGRDFYTFMQSALRSMDESINGVLRIGVWRNNFAENALQHLDRGREIRRQIYEMATRRVSLMEQVSAQPAEANSAERRDQLRQIIVDLDRRITIEEYRQMSLYNFLASTNDFLAAVAAIQPPSRREETLQRFLPGYQDALQRLSGQMTDMSDALNILSVLNQIRHTTYAPSNEFPDEAQRGRALVNLGGILQERVTARQLRLPIAVEQTRQIFVPTGANITIGGVAFNNVNRTQIRTATGIDATANGTTLTLVVQRRIAAGTVAVTVNGQQHSLTVVGTPAETREDALSYAGIPALYEAANRPWAAAGPGQQAHQRAINNAFSEARLGMEGSLVPIMRSEPTYLRVPSNVDHPLQLVTTPGQNDRYPMPTPEALLLGTQIAHHRAIGGEQRQQLGMSMTAARGERITELENERRTLVSRFMDGSDRALTRRITMQSLLIRCEHIGVPYELLGEEPLEQIRQTRTYLNNNLEERENMRRMAQRVYRDETDRQETTMETQVALNAVLQRINKAVGGDRCFVYTQQRNRLFQPGRLLTLLGFASQQANIPRQFTPQEVADLQRARTFVHTPQGAPLRQRLEGQLLQLRSLEGLPQTQQKQIQDRLPGLIAAVRDILTQAGGNLALPNSASAQDVVAILEMLDITSGPVFYARLNNSHVQELVRARRRNLEMIQNYLTEWQNQVSTGRVNMDGMAVLQHVMTMRFLGNRGILSMDVPHEFQNLQDARSNPGWLSPVFNFHDAWMPTGIAERLTGGTVGYNANQARSEGLSLFGWPALMRMPNPYVLLEPALIPPADAVGRGAEAVAKWRGERIAELRAMPDDAARQKWLADHFRPETMQRSVIGITQQHEPRIRAVCLGMGATLETLEALASDENCWHPEDLVLAVGQVQQPGWWQEPPALENATPPQMQTWRERILANMRKVPEGDPQHRQSQREAKWVYDRLLTLTEEQSRLLQTRKREYLDAISNNFNTHISNAALNFSEGDQARNDLVLTLLIAGEGFLTVQALGETVGRVGTRHGLRRVPGVGRVWRAADWIPVVRAPFRAFNAIIGRPTVFIWDQTLGRMVPSLHTESVEPVSAREAARMRNRLAELEGVQQANELQRAEIQALQEQLRNAPIENRIGRLADIENEIRALRDRSLRLSGEPHPHTPQVAAERARIQTQLAELNAERTVVGREIGRLLDGADDATRVAHARRILQRTFGEGEYNRLFSRLSEQQWRALENGIAEAHQIGGNNPLTPAIRDEKLLRLRRAFQEAGLIRAGDGLGEYYRAAHLLMDGPCGSPPDAASAATRVAADASDARHVFLQRLRTINPEVVRALEESGMDITPRVANLVSESDEAMRIFTGARSIEEVEQAIRIANRAAAIRTIPYGIAGALDLFGIYMAYVAFEENGRDIARARQSGNRALADFYQNSQAVIIREGGISATSLVCNGICIYGELSGTASSLIVRSAATVGGLPVAIVAGATMWYSGQLREATATFLRNERDWMRRSPGQILSELERLSRADFTVGEMAVAAAPIETFYLSEEQFAKQYATLEGAAAGVRSALCTAYILQTSSLPRRASETEQAYAQRGRDYVMAQLRYIHAMSRGGYDLYNAAIFRDAKQYADLFLLSRSLQNENGSRAVNVTVNGQRQTVNLAGFAALPFRENRNGPTQQAVLAAYATQQKAIQLLAFAERRNVDGVTSPIERAERLRGAQEHLHGMLVSDIRPEIDRFDAATYGGEARANMAGQLRRALDSAERRMMAFGVTLRLEQYRKEVAELRELLEPPNLSNDRSLENRRQRAQTLEGIVPGQNQNSLSIRDVQTVPSYDANLNAELISAGPHPQAERLSRLVDGFLRSPPMNAVPVITAVSGDHRESHRTFVRLDAATSQPDGTPAYLIRRGNVDVYVTMLAGRLVWSSWGSPEWVSVDRGRYEDAASGGDRAYMNQVGDLLSWFDRDLERQSMFADRRPLTAVQITSQRDRGMALLTTWATIRGGRSFYESQRPLRVNNSFISSMSYQARTLRDQSPSLRPEIIPTQAGDDFAFRIRDVEARFRCNNGVWELRCTAPADLARIMGEWTSSMPLSAVWLEHRAILEELGYLRTSLDGIHRVAGPQEPTQQLPFRGGNGPYGGFGGSGFSNPSGFSGGGGFIGGGNR